MLVTLTLCAEPYTWCRSAFVAVACVRNHEVGLCNKRVCQVAVERRFLHAEQFLALLVGEAVGSLVLVREVSILSLHELVDFSCLYDFPLALRRTG